MKLSELKNIVATLEELHFQLPNGDLVPSHYHVTEVGYITKNFIDCGGVARLERKVTFQLWVANDLDHRLTALKWLGILKKGELDYGLTDEPIEIEYQGQTIESYGLTYTNGVFNLMPLFTECLAPDQCGIPTDKLPSSGSCTPGGGCC